jgi:hypothetical protein
MMTIRKDGNRVAAAAALAINALRRDLTVVGARFHSGQVQTTNANDPSLPTVTSTTITAATAADLPTSLAMVNQIFAVLTQHFAESTSVHLAADPTAVAALAAGVVATDLATGITLMNLCKSVYNTHCAQSGVHFNNDGTNTFATTNASDLPTLITLANAAKPKIVAHMASAPAGFGISLVAA